MLLFVKFVIYIFKKKVRNCWFPRWWLGRLWSSVRRLLCINVSTKSLKQCLWSFGASDLSRAWVKDLRVHSQHWHLVVWTHKSQSGARLKPLMLLRIGVTAAKSVHRAKDVALRCRSMCDQRKIKTTEIHFYCRPLQSEFSYRHKRQYQVP